MGAVVSYDAASVTSAWRGGGGRPRGLVLSSSSADDVYREEEEERGEATARDDSNAVRFAFFGF